MANGGHVVVVGGGPSGFAAALAAARNGARVTLVERHGFLGGNMTIGLCMHTFHNKLGVRVIEGIPAELIGRMQRAGTSSGPVEIKNAHMFSTTPVDVEAVKLTTATMLGEVGIAIAFHAPLAGVEREDARVTAIQVATKQGSRRIAGDVFVDATGDGDLAAAAGVPFELGRPGDGRVQPASMVFTVEGVELDRALARAGKGVAESVTPYSDGRPIPVWFSLTTTPWNDLIERKGYFIGKDREWWGNSLRPHTFNINASRVTLRDATDPQQYTAAVQEGLRQVDQMLDFLTHHVDGFEQARLVRLAPFLGIRESRRVQGDYLLAEADVLAGTLFPDRVALGGYPIDIHDVAGGTGVTFKQVERGGTYSIPYRSILAAGAANLLLAGRCMSTTHGAHAGTRVMVTSMAVGEAAGTAAGLAAARGVPPRAVPVEALQARLREQGAKLDP
jgi:2-polyprenyl-6-methoxyphenol hydroxylase-like FAD-dependent oxidoreductase